jgi:hypothetical protein
MPSYWSRVFPARSLAEIHGPAWVRIDARVVSSSSIESPFAGLRCATAKWWLMVRAPGDGRHRIRLRPIASGWLGESILLSSVDGPIIRVPLAKAELANSMDPADGVPIQELPDIAELAALASETKEELFFREVLLREGDRVELRAVVERLPSTAGYRDVPRETEFQACPEHGKVEIFDRDLR